MASARSRGKPIAVEELLAKAPNLDTEQAVRLVYEDVCLRRESGEEVLTAEVVNRFPQWKVELELLLGCDRLLRPLREPTILPDAGENLGPFRLLSELGRGASGKTFLAVEPALADRHVVLKVMPDDQDEHLSLARLQHTHIIPLFSEQVFPDRGLRALCMPYLGGASLGQILQALVEIPPEQRRGRHLLDTIDRLQKNCPSPSTFDGPYRRYLEQAPYTRAICWIGACLADALHEAHAHRLVHMDVKPSNVLIAGDGLPMLLDFHLARKPIRPGERVIDRLGGTPGWMAPEQADAVNAVSTGIEVPGAVDRRADIHALGLLLREALVGPGTLYMARSRARWRHRNLEVSPGLAEIVERCLAINPEERYPDAAALAEDLRRHLNDLPLRGVSNRSLSERWRKWRRRRPGGLVWAAAGLATFAGLAVAVTLGLAFHRQRASEITADLQDARRFQSERSFEEATRILTRALRRADGVPAIDGLRQDLAAQIRTATLGRKADALHQMAEIIRFRHGTPAVDGPEARQLLDNAQAAWAERDSLLGEPEGTLTPDTEQTIRSDLLELVLVWADLRVQLASGAEADLVAARRDALRTLDQADALCGPSLALNRQRRAYAQALGEDIASARPDPPPRSAWEHDDLGRYELRAGHIAEAAAEFERALELDPQDFWANFHQGLCAYRLNRFEEAFAAFRTCVALSPGTAECYYNRALAAEVLGRKDQAMRDYSHALALHADFSEALLNRGILLYQARKYDEAITDFEQAIRKPSGPASSGRTRYNLALAYLAQGDRAQALSTARQAAADGYPDARTLQARLERGTGR